MPEYIYQCEDGHKATVAHGMQDCPRITCSICSKPMYKRPQALHFRIMRDLSPAIAQHIQDVPKLRDEYEAKHGD
jgi:hypothetical protein